MVRNKMVLQNADEKEKRNLFQARRRDALKSLQKSGWSPKKMVIVLLSINASAFRRQNWDP